MAKEKTGRDVKIGDIVLFTLDEGPDIGQDRPALVVRVWTDLEGKAQENGVCQLQVFTDSDVLGKFNDQLPQVMWKTSIVYSDEGHFGAWHW